MDERSLFVLRQARHERLLNQCANNLLTLSLSKGDRRV
jgi:hypothetical protein